MISQTQWLTTAAGLAAAVIATPAPAQPMPTANAVPTGISQEQFLALAGRLDALEKRNQELEQQIADLRAQTTAADQKLHEQASAHSVSLANGRPTLATGDGKFTASLRGIFQMDAALYDQRRGAGLGADFRRGFLGDAGEADHARDLTDGTNFRRARFGVEGRAWGDWSYNLLFDFGGSGVEDPGKIINAYVEYTGLQPVRMRLGAFAPITGLEDATPASASLFLERAAVAEMVRGLAGSDGRAGAALMANGERWSLYTALTGNLVNVSTFDEQLGFIGRGSFLPYKTNESLLHVGASANIIVNPAATGPSLTGLGAATPVRLRERPELRVDGTRLVDTGAIDANRLTVLGLEMAVQHKALSVQAEHFSIDLDRRPSALANPRFNGWYLQGAWTITGQPRRYNTASGGFESPRVADPFKPGGNPGVWELAARYSVLDLNYRASGPGTAAGAAAVSGGEQKIVTLGVNWYPNNNLRFLADYQHVAVDRISLGGTAFGPGPLTPPTGAQIGQSLNIWSLRTQYAF